MRLAFFLEGRVGWMAGYTYLQNLFNALHLVDQRIEICLLRRLDDNLLSSPSAAALAEVADYVWEYPTLDLERWSRGWIHAQVRTRVMRHEYPDKTLDRFLEAHHVDVVFGSWWQYPKTAIFPSVGVCAWLHDFQFLHLPSLYDSGTLQSTYRGVHRMAEVATRLVVSSQDALKDLLSFAPGAAPKARVLPFVADIPPQTYTFDPEVVLRPYHLPHRFIYLPNQFWQHKNHRLVLAALHILAQRGVHPYIVCTGLPHDYKNPGHFAELLRQLAEWELRSQVIFLGLVPIDHVKALMRQAVCVLNPSLFEGWSSTVEEAKSLGKRLLLSDLPVHREQNPPEAVFFDPHDAEGLAAKLQAAWQDWRPGADPSLETMARQSLQARMRQFGETFVGIVSEVVATRK